MEATIILLSLSVMALAAAVADCQERRLRARKIELRSKPRKEDRCQGSD
ncbi:MAG: hypothetical protein PVG60_02535 [Desulfarculaceae bacterium]